jgi:hypothetical protein
MIRIAHDGCPTAGSAAGSEIGREVRVDLAAAGDLNDLWGVPLHPYLRWFASRASSIGRSLVGNAVLGDRVSLG